MDFKNISVEYQPCYAWNWNGHITREGIKERIDKMFESGIKAFYVIASPKNFRPTFQVTNLSPDYMSEEYLDLLYYSFEYATEKGMYTWLYNEGGFPSGMVCGQIREKHPHLAIKKITEKKSVLEAGQPFKAEKNLISAFLNGKRINEGDTFGEDAEITEYFGEDNNAERHINRTDISKAENTKHFLELTHEKLKKRFGKHMGTDITLMFDDEAFMGQWSESLEKDFLEKYGYDIADYMPVVYGVKDPETENEYRAKSDYIMLCGELVRDNYFKGMRTWLNANNMLSTGHVDNDHTVGGIVSNRYGNRMSILRAFDVPGVDEIWGQIDYPKDGRSCPMGNEFFPRIASSAARQQGHSRALSESFAVYGAQMTPELMRYIVNYQSVKGISIFNFMSLSYDKDSPMAFQYRPTFNSENVGMDCLGELDDYTARLSYILQNSKADINTAIYCPYRTVAAWGEKGKNAADAFEELGNTLEKEGISFDIIDEEFLMNCTVENGALKGEFVTYENVFVPELLDFEREEVIERLKFLTAQKNPDTEKLNPLIKTRKIVFDDGKEAYFIFNGDNNTTEERVGIETDKFVYELCLSDGEIYEIPHTRENGKVYVSPKLLRGEATFIYLSETKVDARKREEAKEIYAITDFRKFVSRHYYIDSEKGVMNTYYGENDNPDIKVDKSFSGEITYKCILKDIPEGIYILNLGDVKHFAKIYVNGKKEGISTMPPYKFVLDNLKNCDELTIVVANTIAGACASTDYFDKIDIKLIGTYHQNMVKHEKEEMIAPSISGITLEKIG